MKINWVVLTVILIFGIGLYAPSETLAKAKGKPPSPTSTAIQSPVSQIERFHRTLIELMKQGPKLGFEGRYKLLAPVSDKTFDFAQMMQTSVGPRWDSLSPTDHQKLISAFRNFSISTYAYEFRSYDGEHFKTLGEPTAGRLGSVMVRTQIIPKDDAPVPLTYLMHKTGSEWKIYDVYLAGAVSEVARRREEFSSILRNKGADGLCTTLEEKAAKLAID